MKTLEGLTLKQLADLLSDIEARQISMQTIYKSDNPNEDVVVSITLGLETSYTIPGMTANEIAKHVDNELEAYARKLKQHIKNIL